MKVILRQYLLSCAMFIVKSHNFSHTGFFHKMWCRSDVSSSDTSDTI